MKLSTVELIDELLRRGFTLDGLRERLGVSVDELRALVGDAAVNRWMNRSS
jgi:hypothetical protein